MPTVFAYQALAADGTLDRGTVDAESLIDARASVAARGLMLVSIESRGARKERREPLSAADLALGLRILADLLESGLPVTRALHAFEDLAPKGWHSALPIIRQSVREGKGLASALSDAPIEIPPLVIGIAQAGEAGSGIGPAVRRAAELTEATAEMQSAVKSALAYPMIVAFAGALAIIVLITVVLPRFAKILADLGQKLPASTQLVLHLSDIAHRGFFPCLIIGGVLTAVWHGWSQTDAGHAQWHKTLLMVPVLGNVRRGAATARMANSLSALLESGVPIANAMGFAARATGDAELQRRLVAARGKIIAGQTLSAALDATSAATLTTIKLVRAGEESGRLHGMLGHAAKIEQKRVDQIVKTSVRMLEPVLLLTFASVVALVAAALLQAIYSVRPTV
jgi:type II secretory pathway component PulF